ncbi:semaphorin-4A isoform X2 [Paramormyrops kingsleyae]|uniref:semaphorin-4A isoform X2 n=1 Tax=Paramormyrops kingsleyae TaxID=1676925 RepID=UPI000CD67451|nr:semaphorin-4A-like isoform X2 [Paramormyrops kingsleyae]
MSWFCFSGNVLVLPDLPSLATSAKCDDYRWQSEEVVTLCLQTLAEITVTHQPPITRKHPESLSTSVPRRIPPVGTTMAVRLLFVLVLLGHLEVSVTKLVPRLSFPLGSPGRSITMFSSPDVQNTTMLSLSDDNNTLLVGARDSVLSLDVSRTGVMEMKSKLDWSPSSKQLDDCSMKGKNKADCHNFIRVLNSLNDTHVYACGTHAFSPLCTYIDLEKIHQTAELNGKSHDGRGRCPYDPYQKNTAIAVAGELYTGTVADYRGNRPVISRYLSQGNHADLKLDDTMGWLDEPTFVSSEFIPSEDKVYVFFSEVGREYEFLDKIVVSRVAQVCTSDIGGQRTLQRRWTTFAKAQVLCKNRNQLPYNVILDIVSLPPPEGASEDEMLFYGIFGSQWFTGQSAVCTFQLGDIKTVFAGNYKVLNRDTLRWGSKVQDKMASPGQCGLHNASDTTLRFVKDNFLADQAIPPASHGLTMVSPDRYTNIAAQRVRGASGKHYDVLFLLTESGFLHKTVLLETGPRIIEEIQVFKNPQSVKNILLSDTKGVVFVGFSEGVAQVPVSDCSFYSSCAECVLARDPFCGWDRSQMGCVAVSPDRDDLGQDVDEGNVMGVCTGPKSRSGLDKSTAAQLVLVSLNKAVTLQCQGASRLSTLDWHLPSGRSHDDYLWLPGGGLQFLATPDAVGNYTCYSDENGHRQTVVVYSVKLKSSLTPRGFNPALSQGLPLTTSPRRPPLRRPTEARPTTKGGALTSGPMGTTAIHIGAGSTESGDEQEVQQKNRNLTTLKQPQLIEGDSSPNVGQLPLANEKTYYRELVTVSVLLSLTLCALILTALYAVRPRARGLQICPSVEPGSASQERTPLSGDPPPSVLCKQNGQPQDKSLAVSNGALRSSNGHLPNTPYE